MDVMRFIAFVLVDTNAIDKLKEDKMISHEESRP